MLAPQVIAAAVGIGTQQAQINDARADERAVATRLGRIAHLQATLDATEDAVLRESGGRAAGPRVRGTLARANPDVLVLHSPVLSRDFERLQTLAAGDLDTRASLERLEAPLDGMRITTAQLADETVERSASEAVSERSDRRAQLLVTVLAFGVTLMITLMVARLFIASIRRPLRSLRGSALKLGSGDLTHRVELDSFAEFNAVADAFNAMSDALRKSDHELDLPRLPRPAHGPGQPGADVQPHHPRARAPRARGHRRPARRPRRLQVRQRGSRPQPRRRGARGDRPAPPRRRAPLRHDRAPRRR